jgi:hypothetical protein
MIDAAWRNRDGLDAALIQCGKRARVLSFDVRAIVSINFHFIWLLHYLGVAGLGLSSTSTRAVQDCHCEAASAETTNHYVGDAYHPHYKRLIGQTPRAEVA